MANQSLKTLTETLAGRLTERALPGELKDFGPSEVAQAAAFVAATAAHPVSYTL